MQIERQEGREPLLPHIMRGHPLTTLPTKVVVRNEYESTKQSRAAELVIPQVVNLESVPSQRISTGNGEELSLFRLPPQLSQSLLYNEDIPLLFSIKGTPALAPVESSEAMELLTREANRIEAKTALLRRAGIRSDLWELTEIPLRFVRPAPPGEVSQGGGKPWVLHREGMSVFYEVSARKAAVFVSDSADVAAPGIPRANLQETLQRVIGVATEAASAESSLDAVIYLCQRFKDGFLDACQIALDPYSQELKRHISSEFIKGLTEHSIDPGVFSSQQLVRAEQQIGEFVDAARYLDKKLGTVIFRLVQLRDGLSSSSHRVRDAERIAALVVDLTGRIHDRAEPPSPEPNGTKLDPDKVQSRIREYIRQAEMAQGIISEELERRSENRQWMLRVIEKGWDKLGISGVAAIGVAYYFLKSYIRAWFESLQEWFS
jgi:hypothetical protein